jgi:hypothetical protein
MILQNIPQSWSKMLTHLTLTELIELDTHHNNKDIITPLPPLFLHSILYVVP